VFVSKIMPYKVTLIFCCKQAYGLEKYMKY
jgi:hypothetical protein